MVINSKYLSKQVAKIRFNFHFLFISATFVSSFSTAKSLHFAIFYNKVCDEGFL